MTSHSLTLTVSQLTKAIKLQLESQFSVVCVQGEVFNFKRQTSGHLYFTLKDQDSQVQAVMFRGNTLHLTRLPKEGDQVIVQGEISVYQPRGTYQIIVRSLRFSGIGELLVRFEELKNKLKSLGWFDQKYKKKLPGFPKKVGVVTSPTGAVIQDILNVLNRRHSGFQLVLNPVKVQGGEAAKEIAKAIEQFNQYQLVDVLIVARGGGSFEDLWAFNELEVVKSIFKSKIPIITAIGHETDYTISDFVSDIRAPTPSAAAEIVLKEKKQLITFLQEAKNNIASDLRHLIKQNVQRLNGIVRHPIFNQSDAILGTYYQRLDDVKSNLDYLLNGLLKDYRTRLESISKQRAILSPLSKIKEDKIKLAHIETSVSSRLFQVLIAYREQTVNFSNQISSFQLYQIKSKKEHLKSLASHIRSIDPKTLLKKGYSILFDEKTHSVIFSVKDLKPGQELALALSDGKAKATVKKIISEK